MDTMALSMYCEAFATWRQANDHLLAEGMVIFTKKGYPVQSPWFAISRTSHDQMYRLLTQFGMTPSSRGGVQVIGDSEEEANPFAELRKPKKANAPK
jgi:P27 family predicted phage terminase small subunit